MNTKQNTPLSRRPSAARALCLLAVATLLAACSNTPRTVVGSAAPTSSCCCAQPLDNPYFADDETLALCADELVAQEQSLGAGVSVQAENRVSDPLARPVPCFS